MIMNHSATPTRSVGSTVKLYLAGAAVALALLILPQACFAQGVVRGAQQGAYEGDRVAGPIGGFVGGAVGLALVAQSAPLMVFSAFPIGRAAVAFTTTTIVSTAIDR